MKDLSCVHWQWSQRYIIAWGMPVYRADHLMRTKTHELSDDHSDIWVKWWQFSDLIKALAKNYLWHDMKSLRVVSHWWWHVFYTKYSITRTQAWHFDHKVTYNIRTAKPDLLKLSPNYDFFIDHIWTERFHLRSWFSRAIIHLSPIPPTFLKVIWLFSTRVYRMDLFPLQK